MDAELFLNQDDNLGKLQDDKIGIFQNYLSTLKKTSLDKGSGQKKYMTESEMPVVDFDKVKKAIKIFKFLQVKPDKIFLSFSAEILANGYP